MFILHAMLSNIWLVMDVVIDFEILLLFSCFY